MFEGFSPEAVDFLWGIRFNNNREWYMSHKKEYTTYLNNPLKEMAAELYLPFSDESNLLMKVSRILRDTRMHYEVPYRDSLWLSLRKNTEYWQTVPTLYFSISPEGVDYGLSIWKPEPSQMEQFRQFIAANPQPFLDAKQAVETATGTLVTADLYKRPKPCPDDTLLPYFSWKNNISCIQEEPMGPELFGRDLFDRVNTFWLGTRPLFDYFNQIFTA